MKMRRKVQSAPMTELNVTPLMDLAFSLLIIFMISTPLLEQTIPVELPTQEKNPSNQRPPEVQFQVITIDANAKIFWGKQPVDLPELERLLDMLSKQPEPPAISLRADKNLKYQTVVDIIDAIKRHNLKKLHLDTQVD